MLKKILISILSIIDVLLLYYAACHIHGGIISPVLVGADTNAYFMGLHIMGFTFLAIFAVLLIVIIMLALYMPNGRKKNEKN